MSKAYEVMTHALATCPPDTSLSEVASIMRDRDVGDVLIVENGDLVGIVTDRDLALNALTNEDMPHKAPVHKYMTSNVITGDASWSLKKVAKEMAKHQIRRLPIVQDGRLAGIISLGDVALEEGKKPMVSKSLHDISIPDGSGTKKYFGSKGAWLGLGLAAMAATMFTWLTYNRSGQTFRKQVLKSKYYKTAQEAAEQAVQTARHKLDDAASSKKVRKLRRQIRTNLKDLSAQLPTIEYKSPKRKSIWFG